MYICNSDALCRSSAAFRALSRCFCAAGRCFAGANGATYANESQGAQGKNPQGLVCLSEFQMVVSPAPGQLEHMQQV